MKKILYSAFMVLCIGIGTVSAQNGYILAGWTQSFTHGPAGSDADFLVYRLDAAGNTLWRKNYGGGQPDQPYNYMYTPSDTILRTGDGGYLLMGLTQSYTNGVIDFLVYKLDAGGNKEWRKNYGGALMDLPQLMQETADGGYLLAGLTNTYTNGMEDILVYKIDANGAKQWRRNYGGTEAEYLTTLLQTADGGFLITGVTSSYIHGTPGIDSDLLVYKLDAVGKKQWRKNYGGASNEIQYDGRQIQETADGGYLLTGITLSYIHGTPGSDIDILVYKLDASGNKQWRKNYGGAYPEYMYKTRQAADGGFTLAGITASFTTGPAGSDFDMLVYRLDSKGKKLWRKNYGGIYWDGFVSWPYSAVELLATADGGYILAGETMSFTFLFPYNDFLVYKLDAAGKKQWRRNYGGALHESAPVQAPLKLIATSDGGYLLAGNTTTFTHGFPGSDSDFIAYKLDAGGNILWWNYWGGIYLDVLTAVLEVTN